MIEIVKAYIGANCPPQKGIYVIKLSHQGRTFFWEGQRWTMYSNTAMIYRMEEEARRAIPHIIYVIPFL